MMSRLKKTLRNESGLNSIFPSKVKAAPLDYDDECDAKSAN